MIEHKCYAKSKKGCVYLSNAINKYGWDNFKLEILQECKEDELDSLEIYYIKKYNSRNREIGYNIAEGGNTGPIYKGVDNSQAILTEEIVYKIREYYKQGIVKKHAFAEISKEYEININTFSDVWIGKTYIDIHYDVYDKKFKEEIQTKRREDLSKLTETDSKQYVLEIRNQRALGIPISVCYKQYEHLMSKYAFDDIWYNRTYKYILPTETSENKASVVREHKRNKALDMYNKRTKEFIRHFENTDDAVIFIKGEYNKNYVSVIYNNCLGKSKSAYGYIWKFSNCND